MLQLPLLPDITKYVLAEYVPWDELAELQKYMTCLYSNPHRLTTQRNVHFQHTYVSTCIDGVERRTQVYVGGVLSEDYNLDVNEARHGVSRKYLNGTLWNTQHYVHGVRHGVYIEWYRNGMPEHHVRFVNGSYDGFQRRWDEHGAYLLSRNGQVGADHMWT